MAINFNKLFYEEVREKKLAANGVYSRKGKRGYVGKVLYTSDILRGKKKREYQKNGKVVRVNMYEEIVSYDLFQSFSEDQQKRVLKELRDRFPNSEIRKHWGIGNKKYYQYIDKFELPKKTRIYQEKKKKKPSKKMQSPKERVLTDGELIEATQSIISYEKLQSLSQPEKIFLLNKYCEFVSLDLLAKRFDVNYQSLYNTKYYLNKRMEEGKIEEIKEEDLIKSQRGITEKEHKKQVERQGKEMKRKQVQKSLLDYVKEYEQIENSIEEKEKGNRESNEGRVVTPAKMNGQADMTAISTVPIKENNMTVETNSSIGEEQRNYETKLSFDGVFNKEQLMKKLNTMLELLEDDGRFYKLDIQIAERKE